jgi:hypothetical protein
MGPGKNPPSPEAFSKVLAGYKPVSPRHAAFLKSWRDHASRDDLWRALQNAVVKRGGIAPEPADFIDVVLHATLPTKRLNDHNEHVLKLFQELQREIGAVVRDALYPLNLWQDLQRFEEPLRKLDRSAYDMRTPAGGPKDQNDSRDRKFFAHRMFRYLEDVCGEHLPKQVATMVDILFPGSEDPERTVRSWLPKQPPKRVV